MVYGKKIELFLVNGTADSIVEAELSNWNGKAIKIPRIEVTTCNRENLSQPGAYFLFCKGENSDEKDSVYIGEAENVKERLLQHLRDYQSEKEKYYWNTAVIFIGRDLNKAHIRYLENRFVEIAKDCNRYNLLTKSTYKNTVLKESEIAVMEEFIDNVKTLINVLGYKVLDPLIQQISDDTESINSQILYIVMGNANATGVVTAEGFVVMKNSTINEKTSNSLGAGMKKQRKEIMASNKMKNLTTKEDIFFSSSSAAAEFVLGYSASGPQNWKTKDGKCLKDIE